MRISATMYDNMTGGYMGDFDLDTDTLTSDQNQQVREWVEQSDFFNLPSAMRYRDGDWKDLFSYQVTIEDGDKKHTITADRSACPVGLLELFPFMTQMRIERQNQLVAQKAGLTKHPLAQWEDDESTHDQLVWWSRLDNRWQVEVQRTGDYTAELKIFDHNNRDQLIYQDSVGLSYGAIFGPDAGDVQDWQQTALDVVDNKLTK